MRAVVLVALLICLLAGSVEARRNNAIEILAPASVRLSCTAGQSYTVWHFANYTEVRGPAGGVWLRAYSTGLMYDETKCVQVQYSVPPVTAWGPHLDWYSNSIVVSFGSGSPAQFWFVGATYSSNLYSGAGERAFILDWRSTGSQGWTAYEVQAPTGGH